MILYAGEQLHRFKLWEQIDGNLFPRGELLAHSSREAFAMIRVRRLAIYPVIEWKGIERSNGVALLTKGLK